MKKRSRTNLLADSLQAMKLVPDEQERGRSVGSSKPSKRPKRTMSAPPTDRQRKRKRARAILKQKIPSDLESIKQYLLNPNVKSPETPPSTSAKKYSREQVRQWKLHHERLQNNMPESFLINRENISSAMKQDASTHPFSPTCIKMSDIELAGLPKLLQSRAPLAYFLASLVQSYSSELLVSY